MESFFVVVNPETLKEFSLPLGNLLNADLFAILLMFDVKEKSKRTSSSWILQQN